jgi:TldD protein
LEKLLSKYPYAEARIERGTETIIRIQDEEIKISSGSYQGVSARVLKDGSWGFAASNRGEGIESLLLKAARLASLEKGKIRLADRKPARRTLRRRVGAVPPEEQLEALLDAKKEMAGRSIISRKVSCSDSTVVREFHSSEGARIVEEQNYTFLACTSVAKDSGAILRGSETESSRTGFTALDIRPCARSSREKAQRLLGAPVAPRGVFTVVLDPEMTGVFSHEALGHAAEADSIIDRESILSGRRGRKIGNELVTIIDDPTADGFGAYSFDDEGVMAKRTPIMERGVLKSFINSRETAHGTKAAPNGHARAAGYNYVPIVRMSNTYFQPGRHSREDVFDVRKGVYIKGMQGGSVDIFSGGFMFKAEEAYEIKDGECGRVMRDAAISGNILATLRNVTAVGKDFGTSPGMCGKNGQDAPVSDGGPHIRVNKVMVG